MSCDQKPGYMPSDCGLHVQGPRRQSVWRSNGAKWRNSTVSRMIEWSCDIPLRVSPTQFLSLPLETCEQRNVPGVARGPI